MKNILFSLLFFSIISCKTAQKTDNAALEKKREVSISDSLILIVTSSNLSEDMSTLSSNDDELILLIFSYADSTINNKASFSTSLVLNKSNLSDTINCNELKKWVGKSLILFLLEMDSEKTIEQIEPLVRANHKKLIDSYYKRNYLEIEKCIGDDDLLGIKVMNNFKKNTLIEFSDIHRMDRFKYSLTFQ